MIKMNRNGFATNLIQALDRKDTYITDEDLDKFLDLNFDEDSSLTEWDYSNFSQFAYDVAAEGFWEAVRMNDLHTPYEVE